MKHEESILQRSCVKWFRLQHPNLVLFSIPNGGKRGIVEAKIMKSEGTLPGVPDLFLAQPVGKLHGLFIEMKSSKGKLSPLQAEMIVKLASKGYRVVVCNSFDSFVKEVNDYLNQ